MFHTRLYSHQFPESMIDNPADLVFQLEQRMRESSKALIAASKRTEMLPSELVEGMRFIQEAALSEAFAEVLESVRARRTKENLQAGRLLFTGHPRFKQAPYDVRKIYYPTPIIGVRFLTPPILEQLPTDDRNTYGSFRHKRPLTPSGHNPDHFPFQLGAC